MVRNLYSVTHSPFSLFHSRKAGVSLFVCLSLIRIRWPLSPRIFGVCLMIFSCSNFEIGMALLYDHVKWALARHLIFVFHVYSSSIAFTRLDWETNKIDCWIILICGRRMSSRDTIVWACEMSSYMPSDLYFSCIFHFYCILWNEQDRLLNHFYS